MPPDNNIAQEIFSETAIQTRVKALGETISKDYKDAKEPLIMVILMKGAAIFSSDLARQIKLPLQMDYMIASSYGDNTFSSKEVRIIKDLQDSIQGKHVLLVDDIIDTGHTLQKVANILKTREPASIRICTLLNKKARREVACPVDYTGFEIDDGFVVGYGLDHAQYYRNLPYIGLLEES